MALLGQRPRMTSGWSPKLQVTGLGGGVSMPRRSSSMEKQPSFDVDAQRLFHSILGL
jgi:hypothetical protein